jgi:DHA2 family multidrug resistance protein
VYNPWAIAVVITMATFMELLDTSIANVALPHIGGSLGADASESTWVLTSYLVANAVVLPLSAWLSTVFGRKRFYMICVALFTISSLMCSLAPTLGALVFCRVLQGIGGGGLAPSEQAMLVDAFPPSKRAAAFALYSMAIVAAPAIGPTLGGWLTDNFSWHWCFLINIPIGVLSLMLTSIVVPSGLGEVKHARKPRIDVVGIILVAVGFGCLEVVLDTGQEHDWFGSTLVTSCAVIGGAALLGMIVWELCFAEDPVVELQLLKDRNFLLSCLLYFSMGFSLFGTTVLLPQMFQQLFGYTATQAGKILSPGALMIVILAPFVARSLKVVQAKWMAFGGFVIILFSVWQMLHFDFDSPFRQAVVARMTQGVGMAMMFVSITQIAYSYLPKSKNTQASSITNLFRNLGGSFGIAFVATMLQRRAQVNQTYLGAHVSGLDATTMDRLGSFAGAFHRGGATLADAAAQAQGLMGQTLTRHAYLLSYLDVLRYLFLSIIVAIVLCALVKPFRAVPGESGGH